MTDEEQLRAQLDKHLKTVEQVTRELAESNKTYLSCLRAAMTALEQYQHGLDDGGKEAGRVIGEITFMLTIENLASMDIAALVKEIANRPRGEQKP